MQRLGLRRRTEALHLPIGSRVNAMALGGLRGCRFAVVSVLLAHVVRA